MNRYVFVLAALALISDPLSAAPVAPPPAAVAEAVLPADSRFTVEVEGRGPDVILIPGLGSPRVVWDGARKALGGKYRLHLVQLKGFSGSEAGPNLEGKILDTTVEQLATYVRDHKLQSPVVVGHSMGGLIGLMLVRRHPETVGKLMVVDALPFIGTLVMPNATVAAIEPQAKALRDQVASGYGKAADPAALRMIAARNALKPASQERIVAWTAQNDARVLAQAMYEDMTTDFRPEMAKIATPVMLVYAYSDTQLPKAQADTLYRTAYAAAPHVTYVPVADSGHFVMLDQPQAFEAALAAFLAGK